MQLIAITGRIRFFMIDLLRGTSTIKVLKELRRQQFLHVDELEKIRTVRLNYLFQLAHSTTDYYNRFASYSDLPVLTKDIITANFDAIVSRSFKAKLIRKTTGGSTAEPFAYYTTQKSQSYLWAGILLSWEAAGYRLGEKVAFFAGTSLIKPGSKYQLFYRMLNVEVLHASPLNNEILRRYTLQLNKSNTAIIYGYANAIAVMAEYLNTQPIVRFPALKAVVTTAELLSPKTRASIEKAFGVKVYDQYGCNEAGVSAFECEQGKMHLINTRSVYETAADGALISTDLSNEGFPMLKYNTSDIVEFSGESCSCKRSFPIIKSVIGRQSDVIVDKKNNTLHASFFGIVFSKDISVKRYQLVYGDDYLELNLHTDKGMDPRYYDKYLTLLRAHSSFADYRLKLNEPFVVIKNGKHKELIDNRNLPPVL